MQMTKEVHILKLDEILPNRFQPRIVFDETAINELAESIKEYGVIEPIIVRRVADKYEIIAGERRYKASVLAGKETIPAIITELNDKDSAEIALIENVQRQNLTPIEEAVSYKKILDMGYMNQSELANKLGKTQSTVANKLRLLNLTDEVQEALLQERISERHARSLLKLPNNKQNEMLERIIKERMTVRKTDEEINKILTENNEEGTEKVIENNSIETHVVNEIKEEKGEINMNNNDFMNQFNIPNTPIMETPKVEPVVTEQPVVNNIPQPVVEPSVEPFQPMQQPVVEPIPVVAPVEPVVQTEVVNPTMPSVNVPFEGNFVSPFTTVETSNPVVTEQPVINNIPQPVAEPSVEPFQPMQQPVVEPIPVVAPVEPVVQTINNEPATQENADTPITGRFFNMFGSEQVAEEQPVINNTVEPAVAPVQPMTPPMDFNPFGASNVLETPVVENTTPITEVTNNVQNLEPIPMPTVPVAPEMQAPISQPEMIGQVQPFQLNDNQEFTNASVVEIGTFGNNRMEEPTLEPLMETNGSAQKVEMKEIINMIRNCAAQIEKCGYVIDTDELDFDDNYQVIFKIDKKD